MGLQFRHFYPLQSTESQEKYSQLLLGAAYIGRMSSENKKPYIDYRVIENIFCKSFDAKDIGRKDLSIDAVKEKDGIGIKTFLSKGTTSYEKVAEFNDRAKYPFDYEDLDTLVRRQLICYRNERLEYTIKNFDIENTLYHYVVRDVGRMIICECPMVQIDADSITVGRKARDPHIVRFNDKSCRYQFYTTKNTLYQEFAVNNPFKIIEVPSNIDLGLVTRTIEELTRCKEDLLVSKEYVILPLYSTKEGEVPEKSGLNQWNAGGRRRDYDEVYIPIPSIVHKARPNFFPPRDTKFKLRTPDGKEFVAKVCQANNKALMTDPNKCLGEWLLRDILGLERGKLATMEHLRKKKADTVIIYKIEEGVFQIALHTFGAFEEKYEP